MKKLVEFCNVNLIHIWQVRRNAPYNTIYEGLSIADTSYNKSVKVIMRQYLY